MEVLFTMESPQVPALHPLYTNHRHPHDHAHQTELRAPAHVRVTGRARPVSLTSLLTSTASIPAPPHSPAVTE